MLKEKTMCVGDLVSNRLIATSTSTIAQSQGQTGLMAQNVSFLQSKMDGLNLPMTF